MSLSIEEKATNFETYTHIELVMKLLASAQIELMRRQFTHDRTKLEPPEVDTFTKYTPLLKASTYGSEEYKQMLQEMKPALDHHYSNNRHHPEFNPNRIEDMNLFDLLEMLIDWKCATLRHSNGDINKSLEINKDRFNISPQLLQVLKNTVPWIKDEFQNLKSQKDLQP